MAKTKKTCTSCTQMTEGKTKHHPSALEEYDIRSAEDIRDALRGSFRRHH